MPRPFRYHIWDDARFDGGAPFGTATLNVPNMPIRGVVRRGGESKTFYSLVRDFAELRREGADKGIVDSAVVDVGSSAGGRAIPALKVGKGTRHKVLFTGAHHSREWISVEIPYYVAEYLIRNYKESPTTYKERLVKKLVDTRAIWFVPMVNPEPKLALFAPNVSNAPVKLPEIAGPTTPYWLPSVALMPLVPVGTATTSLV